MYRKIESAEDWEDICSLMDSEIRDEMYLDGCWSKDIDSFLAEYCKRHRKVYDEDFNGGGCLID